MNSRFVFGLAVFAYACGASAQSSVTLYGLIDSGLTYSTNQGGKSSVQAVSGVPVGSHWGLTGAEDLGGGLKTVFKLESGFSGFTGQGYGNNAEFTRQAYVGLASSQFGTLTMGVQYDSIVDYVAPYTSNGGYAGLYFAHPLDVDNTDNSVVETNTIKYKSVNYGGLTFGGVYSLGGIPGQFNKNGMWSAGANYSYGPFGVGAAYLRANSPASGLNSYLQNSAAFTNTVYGSYLAAAKYENILGVGASYTLGQAKFLLSYTNTLFEGGDAGHNVSFKNLEAAVHYDVTPSFSVLGSYTYTFGDNNATDASPKYHQFNLLADYFLSKRTDLYAMAIYEQAAGAAQVAQITGLDASSNRRQLALRIAMKHTF
ncbi:porin [Paraburkholderia agricolaris]|uniref:porin n=1 Tax=Paraburkholderia agricolaris TaxID=2152888 RepID=UPI001291BCE4|nr:porin [Paraburkholderia agricolaris]